MPKLFVHGNPETQAVWSLLVVALSVHDVRDVVLLRRHRPLGGVALRFQPAELIAMHLVGAVGEPK